MDTPIKKIGLISDTHGLLRNNAVAALTGVDLIIHAGDIDNILVIDELEQVAPVHAVRGNMDIKPGVAALPHYLTLKAGTDLIGVIHNRHHLNNDPSTDGLTIIIHGHTHKASIEETACILYVNPGSAGPRRSSRPPTIGILTFNKGRIIPSIVPLDD